MPDDAPIDAALRDLLNTRFLEIQQQLADQAGLAGSTVGFAGDIDLKGHRLMNVGAALEPGDAASASHVEKAAGFSAQQKLMQSYLLDITQTANADELFDLGPPGAVGNLTLVWLKKAGWKAEWEEPVNVVKTVGYYIYFYNDSAGVVYMDAKTGAVVATQALAEKFVETNHYTTALSTGDLPTPFSATGVKIRVVALVKIAGQGKQRGAAVDYASLVGPGTDGGTEDVGAAGAVVGLTLVWGAKKKGFKGTWQVPTLNNLSIKGYWCVFMDNAGTNFMNERTGALASPNTEAGAKVFVTDTRITTNLEASQLASQFTAGVKLKVWAVNRVLGADTDGATSTSSFVAPDGEDAGPPSAVQNLMLVWGAKKKGFKGTWKRPATNNNSIKGYWCVFMDNAGVNFMEETTGAIASPNTEAGAKVFVADTRITTNLERSQLDAAFAAGVKLKVWAVNVVGGADTDGTTATSSFVAPAGEDTGPATVVQNLQLVWGAKKKGFKATWQRPTTNVLSIQGYKVYYSDNAGTNFMNADTGALSSPNTAVGATIFVHDTLHTTGLERADLASQFAAGVKVTVRAVNLIGGVETDGASDTSGFVAPTGEDTGFASQVVNLTLVWGIRKKGFKATWDRPVTNFRSIKGYKIAFMNNAETHFMNAVTGALAAPDSEVGATVFTGDTLLTTGLSYAELATEFKAGVKCRVVPVNVIAGIDTDGNSANSDFVAPGQDVVPIATGALVLPVGLQASGTSPLAPAVANDTIHYSIDITDATDYAALLAAGTVLSIHIPSLAAANRIRGLTAYNAANHRFTLDVALSGAAGNNIAYEIHRGASFAEQSGVTHTTTTVILGTAARAADLGVDDTSKGYTIFCPTQPVGDQIRRLTAYVHATGAATLESSVATALANNACYFLWMGAVGFQNADQTGIASGVPFRLYSGNRTGGAGSVDQNVLEMMPGTGTAWYGADNWTIFVRRKSTAKLKDTRQVGLTATTTVPFDAPASYTPVFSVQASSAYRLSGSDGLSGISYHAEGLQAAAVAPTYNPDPTAGGYSPISIDTRAEIYWPV